jgi:truncated hemoglobin YjbI
MLASGVCQENAGNHVRIERIDAVTKGIEDSLERSAVNDELERALMDRRQRIADTG